MKPILRYDTRVKIMDLMDQGIFETKTIQNIIIAEAQCDASEKQLPRCIAAIKGKHKQGLRPRKVDDIY